MAAPENGGVVWAGVCDCAIHIYEAGRQLVASATFVPPHAPLDAYRAVQVELGFDRVVLSQPTAYGFDNGLLLESLARLGDAARGVAVVAPDVSFAALAELDRRGVRGVRFMMFAGGVLSWDDVAPIAARIAHLGWHLKFQLDGRRFDDYVSLLDSLPVASVIDLHPATFPADIGPADPAGAALRYFVDSGRGWIALSAPYGPCEPAGNSSHSLEGRLLADSSDRCVWASNWPHVNVAPMPANRTQLDWLDARVTTPARLKAVLVDNPARLFGFAS